MNSLTAKASKGLLWVGVNNLVLQFINFGTSILLARILAPSDYGTITIALVVMNGFAVFKELGLGQALIYEKGDIEHVADVTFTLNVIVGILLFAGACIAAPFAEKFYDSPGLFLVIAALSTSILFGAFGIVPSYMLEKRLQFKQKFIAETIPPLVYAIVSLTMAIRGYGYWSLVVGSILSSCTNVVLLWMVTSYRPSFSWNKTTAARLLKYGKHLMITSVLIFIAFNLDRFFLGKFVSLAEVGFYGVAFTIANLASTQITGVAGKVLFPSFAVIGDDTTRLAAAYLKTLRLIAILSIPVAFGVAAIAENLISVVLGSKWLPAVGLVQVLSIYGLVRSIAAAGGNVFMALGKTYVLSRLTLFQVSVTFLSVWILGLKFGAYGVAIGSIIGLTLVALCYWYLLTKYLLIGVWSIASATLIYVPSAIAMVLVTTLIGGIHFSLYATLITQVLLGAAVYLLGTHLLTKGKAFLEIGGVVKLAFSGKRFEGY